MITRSNITYKGGKLAIRSHIYGSPEVQYLLVEERSHGPALMAESDSKDELRAYSQTLWDAFKTVHPG